MGKVTGYPEYMKHSVTFTSVVPQEESAIRCECMNKLSFIIVCSIIEGTDL